MEHHLVKIQWRRSRSRQPARIRLPSTSRTAGSNAAASWWRRSGPARSGTWTWWRLCRATSRRPCGTNTALFLKPEASSSWQDRHHWGPEWPSQSPLWLNRWWPRPQRCQPEPSWGQSTSSGCSSWWAASAKLQPPLCWWRWWGRTRCWGQFPSPEGSDSLQLQGIWSPFCLKSHRCRSVKVRDSRIIVSNSFLSQRAFKQPSGSRRPAPSLLIRHWCSQRLTLVPVAGLLALWLTKWLFLPSLQLRLQLRKLLITCCTIRVKILQEIVKKNISF